ncbi:hypothetical protein EST38_g9261 [Candolleomyces aberdarensis]|uniref:3'-5' exonuclease domain-containing protein n=1 Tax=Candolleomyces aberdarensis TaxID=2316362 RepID=A0A4Q2DDK9_9AGAR|nr:hypothetical protein EST38_g9261 [Candolleomyces aberdarensis]
MDARPQPASSSTPTPAFSTEPPEPSPIPQASAIEKLPPRPAPTCGYVWREWSPNATVVYLRNSDEANRHLSTMTPGCIGFDLEWKPVFAKGAQENPVALVQLANDDMIYLVQVTAMKEFPSKLKEILEDPAYTKAGVGIQGSLL